MPRQFPRRHAARQVPHRRRPHVPIRSQSAAPARRISDCEHTMLPRRLNRQRTTSDILPAHGLADREPGAPGCSQPRSGRCLSSPIQPQIGMPNRVLQQLGNQRTVRSGLLSPPPIGAGICRCFGCCLPEPSCRPSSPAFGRGVRGELAPPRIPGGSPARTGTARKLVGAKHSCKARERERRYTPWVWDKKRRRSSGAGCFGRCRGR